MQYAKNHKPHPSTTPGLPNVLLVNPWIHDFAAYDFWAKPLGLLSLAGVLIAHGLRVSYIDCLDRFHASAAVADPQARHGRGPYRKTAIAAPPGLTDIERNYSRYGIDPECFRHDLDRIDRPDLIMVTSLMTYWYPGVAETIGILKERFPEIPVLLGGIYARLSTEHARAHSGADRVIVDRGESVFNIIEQYTGCRISPQFDLTDFTQWPYPAFYLQRMINYIPILTARGCPFECAYCASNILEPNLQRRSAEAVVAEIAHWHRRDGVVDFAFYDDALLWDADDYAVPMLEAIIARDMSLYFHTPNAIHIRAITLDLARLMKRAGFHTLRLGLETVAFDARSPIDYKVTAAEFRRAVDHLITAGFDGRRIGAYLMVGLPRQRMSAVEASIGVVKEAGIAPVLAYYTPIPHTKMWPAAVAASRYDLEADPIYTNNAILPCRSEEFSWKTLSKIKQLVSA